LQAMMEKQGLGCALLFYSRDVFYYTGTAQPSYLFISPQDYFLYVRSGYDLAQEDVFIDNDRMKEERRLESICKEISSRVEEKKIGTELDILPATQMVKFQKAFPEYEFTNISPLVLKQRMIKDAEEIMKIRKACEAIDKGHRVVLSTLQEGVTELELAAAVENAHRLAGHEGIFFIRQPDFFMSRGPISSGSNLFKISGVVYTITGVGLSPSVPAGPSQKAISKGDSVVVDIPTLVQGYHADQTRTYILGSDKKRIKLMHDNLKEIADYLIDEIKPGMRCGTIYQMASRKAEKMGISDTFLSFGKGRRSQLIGHGIGLELNEPPVISKYDTCRISQGNVIALDMHILKEGVGVVKLEDMILVNDNNNEILTKSPRQIFEL